MGQIEIALELFLTDDPQKATESAKALCELNKQRQNVESEIYKQAVEMVRGMQVDEILTAHDYHPYGYHYVGRQAICDALDACLAPLHQVKELILAHPELDDEQIRDLFNAPGTLPKLGTKVVTALRGADF